MISLNILVGVILAFTWMPALGISLSATFQQQWISRASFEDDERQLMMTIDWEDGCDSISRVEGFDGESGVQIAKVLGEPDSKETFRLGDRPDEFHITLQNHYPLDQQANSDVQLQEWTWARNKCRLTVWLHKKGDEWVGLENIRYPADADF